MIVVDDGSTDNTEPVVAVIQSEDPRVRYIKQQNQKLPGALNTGFRASRGEYLTWTSDDNKFHKGAIEVMTRKLDENPEIGFVYCDFQWIDADGQLLREVHNPGPECLPDFNCVGPCFMYRRQVYEAIGDYDPKWLLVEDYEYWLRVYEHFQLAHIPLCLFSFMEHKDSLTTRRYCEQQLLDARVRLKHARVQLKTERSWRKKISIFVGNDRRRVAVAFADMGNLPRAVGAAFIHAACQPWRRYRWQSIIEVWRTALKSRRRFADLALKSHR